ncbi:serine/threonine protein kinase [Kribbella voronezhensis]|uniref:non-specific serine/threonine protein kinase n=1 Tax=Kribbella voronezhensis TaxID=2512212 RepID=A0A4R7SV39_9ACTN|nr:serine/threonine-protein kinase [Kribbella voronezhensis]TDU83152.1 serine/threonine protein kinase [Kribbella voronezhensis]
MTKRILGGRYELHDLPLARGGMGEVWVGRDVRLEREVAVKFLRFPDGTPDDQLIRRFVRESRITARLEHPGIPAVYDVGTDDGRPYLVMQRINGTTLADVVAESGALPVGWVAAIAAQICAVLTVAHRASLVHRDLKPGNVMLCPDGTVKVLDFGLAVALDLRDISEITRTGQTIGTPAYMAPEQVMAALSGPQSDLYALGCTMHEMLTGRRPFTGTTPYSIMNKQVSELPLAVRRRRAEVPQALDELVLELMEKKPDNRPVSAEIVFDRLSPFIADLGPLPPVLRSLDGHDAVRMYAEALSQVGSRRTAPAGPRVLDLKVGAQHEPKADLGTFSRGRLARARQEAAELVDQSRFTQAADVLDALAEPATHAFGSVDSEVVSLRLELADVLFEGGNYRAAGPIYHQLGVDLATVRGPNDELVFRCRLQEATCQALIGQSDMAIEQLQALLSDENRVLGSNDSRTLELRRQIGLLQLGAGRIEESTELLGELLADLERLRGIEDPLTIRVRDLLNGLPRTEG